MKAGNQIIAAVGKRLISNNLPGPSTGARGGSTTKLETAIRARSLLSWPPTTYDIAFSPSQLRRRVMR